MNHLFPPQLRLARPVAVDRLHRRTGTAAGDPRPEGEGAAGGDERRCAETTMTNEARRRRPHACSSPAAAAASARRPAWLCAQRGWAVAVNYARDARRGRRGRRAIAARRRHARSRSRPTSPTKPQVLRDVRDASTASCRRSRGLVNNAGVVDLPARGRRDERRRACSACSRSTCSAASSARARRCGGCRPSATAARRTRRRDRQPVVGGGALGAPGQYVDYAAAKGAIDDLHDRPGEGGRDRRHPRQRGAPRHHRDRDPRLGRHARPRAADDAAAADAARRQRRRGGRGDRLAAVRAPPATRPARSST